MSAPAADGRLLTLWRRRGAGRARRSRRFSARDARSYPQFLKSFAAVAASCARLTQSAPPAARRRRRPADLVGAAEGGEGLQGARQGRRVPPAPLAADAGRRSRRRMVRDRVRSGRWSRAAASSDRFSGPRSPGSAARPAAARRAASGHPAAAGWTARGGTGAVSDALARAARASGAEIRTGRRRSARSSSTAAARRRGPRRRANGSRRGAVLSNADPDADAARPRRSGSPADGSSSLDVRNIRMRGTLAKVNFAVSSLPRLTAGVSPAGRTAVGGALGRGPAQSRPEQRSSARSTRRSTEQYSERAVDRADRPVGARSGSRAGRVTSCRPTCSSRRTSCAARRGPRSAIGSAAAVAAAIERYAPGFAALDCRAAGHHAARSRGTLRPDRRPHLSRRDRARSIVRRDGRCSAGHASRRRFATCSSAAPARTPGRVDGLSGALAARAVIDALRRR